MVLVYQWENILEPSTCIQQSQKWDSKTSTRVVYVCTTSKKMHILYMYVTQTRAHIQVHTHTHTHLAIISALTSAGETVWVVLTQGWIAMSLRLILKEGSRTNILLNRSTNSGEMTSWKCSIQRQATKSLESYIQFHHRNSFMNSMQFTKHWSTIWCHLKRLNNYWCTLFVKLSIIIQSYNS